MNWDICFQRLTEGKPLDAPTIVASRTSLLKARDARRTHGQVWRYGYPNRSVREAPGRTVLSVAETGGLEVIGYFYVEDRRPKASEKDARWAVEVQGLTVARFRSKAEAARRLYQEVERWRSSRWPARRADPAYPRAEWSRQILKYYLTDRKTFAGEICLLKIRRNE